MAQLTDNQDTKIKEAAPALLKALTAMLLVYPAGGHGDSEDREAAVYQAIKAYEAATGKKWRFTGSREQTRAFLKGVDVDRPINQTQNVEG